MNDFKLLAVRPLFRCHQRFLKNLRAGELYPLFNDYTFNDETGDEVSLDGVVHEIVFEASAPQDLYDTRTADLQPLKVQVSAIAGKNGTGKSTIIELLFAAVFVFATKSKLLEPNEDTYQADLADMDRRLKNLATKIEGLDTVTQRDFFGEELTEPINKLTTNFDAATGFFNAYLEERSKLKAQTKSLEKKLLAYHEDLIFAQQFARDLKVELYFQLDQIAYRLRVDDELPGGYALTIIETYTPKENPEFPPIRETLVDVDSKTITDYFFYTIAVNYSHYALNSNITGSWINALFHKNDAYKTPLVINPMRNDGNFDINDEIQFARYRLLSNLLVQQKYLSDPGQPIPLTGKQSVANVVFTINLNKVKSKKLTTSPGAITGQQRADALIIGLLAAYFPGFEYIEIMKIPFALKDDLANYIVQKIDKIARTYREFSPGFDFSKVPNELANQAFFKSLVDDDTHITYKLDQAVNFWKQMAFPKEKMLFNVNSEQLDQPENIRLVYTVEELHNWIGKDIPGEKLIEHLPPPVFNIDFKLLATNTPHGPLSDFTELSSGEQQSIHCIQSVIYHLHNLQSAHFSKKERPKYQAVNIIYDEIELYFHPAYQRSFLSELLKSLERLHTTEKSGIRSVNILFLTHSPFILSDIPKQNILLLEIGSDGKASPKISDSQTFAANINDLLADSFFLEGSLMGEFAEDKVDKLIAKLTGKKSLSTKERRILELIGDSFLRSSLNHYLKEQNRDQYTNQQSEEI